MLIAFASSDGKTIDSHFASAPSFTMYKFDGKEFVISSACFSSKIAKDSEDKVDARISLLKECDIVYCTQIGGPAAARLVQSGIHPLKVQEGTVIIDELNRLSNRLLSEKLPPWLKKKLDNVES